MSSPAMTIAVTGGAGFVGRALLKRLLADGFQVRALINKTPIDDPRVDCVSGGLLDQNALSGLCDGADLIVHAAGLTQAVRDADLFRVNADGAARLAEAASRTGARVLHVSSLAASRPEVSAYAASKAAGEEAIASVLAEDRRVILRPPAVYGPGDEATAPFFRMAGAGFAPILVGDDRRPLRFSLIFVDDLVAAITALLTEDAWGGRCIALRDAHGDGYEWGDIWDAYERTAKKRVRRFVVREGIARVLAFGDAWRTRLFGGAPALTVGKVRELFAGDWIVRGDELTDMLGWRPTVGLDEGLARTAAWVADRPHQGRRATS